MQNAYNLCKFHTVLPFIPTVFLVFVFDSIIP